MKLSPLILPLLASSCEAFLPSSSHKQATTTTILASSSSRDDSEPLFGNRRQWLQSTAATATAALLTSTATGSPANAQVFFDPAQYGDQELRVAAVDSLKESVRRAILQKPALAPAFYQLAVLDALSYNAATNQYGPDGTVVTSILSRKATNTYMENLQAACLTLLQAEKNLKKLSAISIADAVALAGAGAIESIGGPVLTVQLGRADTAKNTPVNTNFNLNLLSGQASTDEIVSAFRQAGMTEREMTAILSGLLTLETVERTSDVADWKASAKPKFREPGKMGRMSEFKRLTDEDIAEAEAQAALEADPEYQDPDDGWYIADSFGDRESRFGQRIGKEAIDEKTFNKYLQSINDRLRQKKTSGGASSAEELKGQFGWIATVLTDTDVPTTQQWLAKYAGSNLSYLKDLNVAYNSMTQLGAVYTGGKYENLLKNKPRKTLNDDDLKLF